jgi:hypothetical protein
MLYAGLDPSRQRLGAYCLDNPQAVTGRAPLYDIPWCGPFADKPPDIVEPWHPGTSASPSVR